MNNYEEVSYGLTDFNWDRDPFDRSGCRRRYILSGRQSTLKNL
jgi:hypothetical protein